MPRSKFGNERLGKREALEPLIESCSGVWVAHGAGTADHVVVDWRDGLDVPPANPLYRLRRVWLDANEERGYYGGFSNEGLWMLTDAARLRANRDLHHYQQQADMLPA